MQRAGLRRKERLENRGLRTAMSRNAVSNLGENASWSERRAARRDARRTANQMIQGFKEDEVNGEQNRIRTLQENGAINALSARQTDRLARTNAQLTQINEKQMQTTNLARAGSYERTVAAQGERQRRIIDEETRASLRGETYNFDIAQTTSLLETIAQNTANHPSTDADVASRIRVLAQALASTGPGKSQLARLITDPNANVTPEVRNFIAGEAQNDPSLAGAIKSKDAFAARYLSDINAAANTRPDDRNYAVAQATLGLSYNQWLNQATTHDDANPGETNLQYVVRRDLSDDADLAKLSSAALQSATNQMSLERLDTIIHARNYHSLFSDADRRRIIEQVFISKGGTL